MSPHLRVFGPPVLIDGDGQPLSFRTRKQLALLVFLVLEGRQRPAPRELLLEYFWPAVGPQRGRHSLSQALSCIRSRLGSGAVTRDRHTVQLLEAVSTDLDRLEATDLSAAQLERPLDELDRVGSATFGHWVDAERERCRKAVKAVLARQMDEARAKGDVNRVYERAAHLYRIDPLSATAVHALAEQLLQDSDTAATCKLIRSYCARVESEVGGQPSADLLRLLRRIEAGAIRPPVGLPVEATRRLARAEVFVGREAELARLEALWSQACRGKLVTCLVAGPAGIGKSSLLRRFAMSVTARGGTALEVACQEIGRTIPFAAVSDLIQVLTRDPAVSGTDPRWLAEASRVSPSIRAAYPGIPEPPTVPAESVRVRIAEALVQVMNAVTESRPTLLTIDDIENLDAASRDVLALALRRMRLSRTMIGTSSVAFRHFDTASHKQDHLVDFGWDDLIPVPPMDDVTAHRIVDALLDDQRKLPTPLVAPILRLASGNPLLIERLLTDWQQNQSTSLITLHFEGRSTGSGAAPPTIMRKMMRRQCAGLTLDAQQMVNVLAVARKRLSTEHLCRLLGRNSTEVDHAALQLLERRLACLTEGGLTLRNELEREFLYFSIDPDRRRFHHSQIGSLLASVSTVDDFQVWLEVCHHFHASGQVEHASRAIRQCAGRAIEGGAASDVEVALRALLSDMPQNGHTALQLLLARCQAVQGKYRDAHETISTIDTRHLQTDQQVQASILLAEALHRGRLANDHTIRVQVRDAFNLTIELGPEAAQLRILQTRAEQASEDGDPHGLATAARAARQIRTNAANRETRVQASLSIAYCHLMSGEVAAAEREFAICADALRSDHLLDLLRKTLNGQAICHLSTGRFDTAIDLLREAIGIAEKLGDYDAAANAWSNLGSVYDDLGRFDLAADYYLRAAEKALATCSPRRLAEISINAAGLALSLGLIEHARLFATSADTQSNRAMQWRLMVDVYNLKADLELASGRQDAAWTYVNRAEALRGERSYLLADVGRHERLRQHYRLSLATPQRLQKPVSDSKPLEQRCPQLADQLEVLLFEECYKRSGRPATSSENAMLQRTVELGLYGVIARLDALDVGVFDDAELLKSEASATRVARALRHCELEDVERSISRCLSLAELLRSDKKHQPDVDRTEYPSTYAIQGEPRRNSAQACRADQSS